MLLHTSSVMGMIFLIMASASILGWLLASERIPELVSRLVLSISTNPHVVMLLINLFLLFVGMFMDIGAALVILAPILAPLAISVGVNPLHFGVIMTINLNIGLITPPLGACLFVACGIGQLKLEEVVPDLWPFILAEVAVLPPHHLRSGHPHVPAATVRVGLRGAARRSSPHIPHRAGRPRPTPGPLPGKALEEC